ncbi:unnamed protein product [Pelagomonas calceolata]|uniref:Uncharacterized protein n=1 Tax=Pelagomonas calceolata TaxID=35677 RepID=A0A8J2SK03_9STRA|nr:unnamed protein product [Pelagomonas calceolata]
MPKRKTPTDSEAAERQKLVNRYVGKEFDDDDEDEGERKVVGIEKEDGDWMAVTVLVVGEGNEQPYLVNESLDEMIDAHKKTQDKDNDSDFERPGEESDAVCVGLGLLDFDEVPPSSPYRDAEKMFRNKAFKPWPRGFALKGRLAELTPGDKFVKDRICRSPSAVQAPPRGRGRSRRGGRGAAAAAAAAGPARRRARGLSVSRRSGAAASRAALE